MLLARRQTGSIRHWVRKPPFMDAAELECFVPSTVEKQHLLYGGQRRSESTWTDARCSNTAQTRLGHERFCFRAAQPRNHACQPTSHSISMRAGISFNLPTNNTTTFLLSISIPDEKLALPSPPHTHTHTTLYLSSLTRPLLFAATRATVSADQRTELSISSKYPDTFLCL